MKFHPWKGSLLIGLVIFAGCQRAVPLTYEPSQQVQALGSEAEDKEEKQLWAGLQEQIIAELEARCGTPLNPKLLGQPDMDPAHLLLGAEVYALRCQPCHGVNGDGNGPVAKYLNPKPRDYRKGIFKFTSTPYGGKPRRADLLRTIRNGVTGTSMPKFNDLPPEELDAVVDYVLALTHRGELEQELAFIAEDEEELDEDYVEETVENVLAPWEDSQNLVVMPETSMPPMTAESILEGHKYFLKQACNKCHGKDGRGGSLGNVEVGQDAWGNKAAAADLTSGMFRGGGRPIDIYRRIYAGINGTPMPAFSEAFQEDPDAIWKLVHFVMDTGQRRRRNQEPLDAAQIEALERELGIATPASGEQPAEGADGSPEA